MRYVYYVCFSYGTEEILQFGSAIIQYNRKITFEEDIDLFLQEAIRLLREKLELEEKELGNVEMVSFSLLRKQKPDEEMEVERLRLFN